MVSIVHVHWHDAESTDAWIGRKTFEKIKEGDMYECDSIGMLVKESEDRIVLLMTTSNRDSVSGTLTIPRGFIKSITTLCTLPIEVNI